MDRHEVLSAARRPLATGDPEYWTNSFRHLDLLVLVAFSFENKQLGLW